MMGVRIPPGAPNATMVYILDISPKQLGELGVRTATFIVHHSSVGVDDQEVELLLEGPDIHEVHEAMCNLFELGLSKELSTVFEDYIVTDMKMHYNKDVVDWCNVNNIPVPDVLNKKSNNFVRGLVFPSDEAAMQFKLRWLT
jgi:hypothetical protein